MIKGGLVMSIELAKAYLERVKTDEAFAKKVNSFEDKVARRDFVLQAGYTFTKEEIEEVSSELNEKDLDAVAGGCFVEIPVRCIVDL
jgi:predicted ribosomally synthesized peptide with nif11-like leader